MHGILLVLQAPLFRSRTALTRSLQKAISELELFKIARLYRTRIIPPGPFHCHTIFYPHFDPPYPHFHIHITMQRDFTVAIVGGGIVGLVCAIELARAGIQADVFEAAVSTAQDIILPSRLMHVC